MRRRRLLQLFATLGIGALAGPSASDLVGSVAQSRQSTTPDGDAAPLLPLFPLPLVLFPGMNLPLHIFEPRYQEMIRDCLLHRWEFGILLMRGDRTENIGCTASVSEIIRSYQGGRMDILVQGRRRFEVSLLNRERSYLRGRADFFEDDMDDPPAGEELRQEAVELYKRLGSLLEEEEPSATPPPNPPPETFDINSPQLSFHLASETPADLEWKQRLLQLRSERERLTAVVLYLQRMIELLEQGKSNPVRRA